MNDLMDRRRLLARSIWGVGGGVVATSGLVATAAPAHAGKHKTVSYDVACLLNTFTFIKAPGATDPFTNFYGTTFFVEGELYRAGTIPDGVTNFDPAKHKPMGHWFCRGWFVNRKGRRGLANRTDPHVISTQEYFFSRITASNYFPRNQLSSSGLEGDLAGKTSLRSVIGGAGKYEGARGSVLQHVTGSNVTDGPNFRFDFRLVDDD